MEHLKKGDFTDTFGLHSIAPSDRIHYDRQDCDWGGGGQYVGMSARIVESLYQLGERGAAWDILKRCTRWTEAFPYWPQTIYADRLALQEHEIDWPLQLSGGGGVTAVTAGVFGIHPQLDGALRDCAELRAGVGRGPFERLPFSGQHLRCGDVKKRLPR